MMVQVQFWCHTFSRSTATAECEARVEGDKLIVEKLMGPVKHETKSGTGPLLIGLPWTFNRVTGKQVPEPKRGTSHWRLVKGEMDKVNEFQPL